MPSLQLALRLSFKHTHESMAKSLFKAMLHKSACRIAVKQLLQCVWKKRRENAGLLLKSVQAVNNLGLSVNNLGERFHTVASEPYFYDTAYTPYRFTGAIPVDEYGQCCVATEIGSRNQIRLHPRRLRCTEECTMPGIEQVCSILAVKAWFYEPIQDLRKLPDTLDEGCQHGHYFSQISLEVGEELNIDEKQLSMQLRSHPIVCASGSCSSLIRNLAAVAVHYPQLRRFLLCCIVLRSTINVFLTLTQQQIFICS